MLQGFARQYGLNEEEFLRQAVVLISGDFLRFLEIDKYVDLKLFPQDTQPLS